MSFQTVEPSRYVLYSMFPLFFSLPCQTMVYSPLIIAARSDITSLFLLGPGGSRTRKFRSWIEVRCFCVDLAVYVGAHIAMLLPIGRRDWEKRELHQQLGSSVELVVWYSLQLSISATLFISRSRECDHMCNLANTAFDEGHLSQIYLNLSCETESSLLHQFLLRLLSCHHARTTNIEIWLVVRVLVIACAYCFTSFRFHRILQLCF